jgi:tRNA A-37 threonylcarbamoyl transferase component Bud32
MMGPMSSDDDLLFAEHVVKAGFLTREEVDESLSVQKRMEEMGVHDSLRNVLVKRRVLREGDAAIVARNAGLRSGGEPIPGYTLEARLGSGAMGSVYKAWQKGMKRHVAMKILRRDLTDDPRQVERLQREAALVGKLDHPNIVRGLDSGETDGLVWFVMELVDGETLRERITRLGRIEAADAVRITRQLAEALDHAAAHGVVHRDVKPGNILVSRDGTPRLTDYGLAKGETDDALTQLDATLGTPQYISPEQARNPRDADIRSDVYSLGATLYAMLTGHPPFAGETMAATLTKVLYERPEPLAKEAPGTPPALAYVVERMMAKDRRHRYQTPGELLHDLRALEEGRLVVPAGFKGDIGEFVETRRHRRLWLAGAGLLAAAVALAAGVHLWESRTAVERRRDEASHELASLRQLAGPADGWDGETIERMLAGYERIGHDYAGTPAAKEALDDVRHWTRQKSELQRAQEAALRAGETPSDWPRLVADVEQRLSDVRGVDDASVARRRLTDLAADVRERRDRHAKEEFAAATAAATASPSIDQAGAQLDAAAVSLRAKYFGDERSDLVDGTKTAAARFRDAAAALDRAFAPYEGPALKEGGLARGDFRTLDALLETTAAAARRDEKLVQALASLEPAGTRSGAIDARRDVLHSQIQDASAAAWEKVRADADDRRSRRDWEGAAEVLVQFAARALDAERQSATALREKILRLHEGAETSVRKEADESAARFFEALGRRDYGQARETLDALAPVAASARSPSNPAADLVLGGRRLLELVDKTMWTPLRARLAKGPPFERDLAVRSGAGYMGYGGIREIKVGDRDLSFTLEGGQTWKGSIYDLALDDVVFYAGLTPSDPERALVLAAVRLAEYVPPSDPAEGLRVLTDTAAVLDAARASPALAPMTQRVARLRDDLLAKAREQVQDVEQRVEMIHRNARTALDSGNYDAALLQLQSLLDVKSFYRSDYVKAHREEIAKQKEAALLGRQQANYAAHFPGAAFSRSADGSGELFLDFENPALATPEGRRLLGLVEGRTEIASRPSVVADRPGLVRPDGAASVPLALEHVLAWRPADDKGSPRDFPVAIDCPFSMRSKIAVSFLYRSDSPFFFAVSIGGVTAGILSAPDDRFNGRGVLVWNAKSLDRPDKEFDDRYRNSYLAKHPEALKKDGDRRYFCFEPGRAYRVEFVKDDRKASLWVDGQLRFETDWRPTPGVLDGKITLTSFSAAEVDDLRITGILDPEWLRGR